MVDSDYLYGYYWVEMILFFVVFFIMMVVGIEVLIGGGRVIMGGIMEMLSFIVVWMVLGSVVFMYGIYLYNKRLVVFIKSFVLMVVVKDSRLDVFVSVGVFIGVLLF